MGDAKYLKVHKGQKICGIFYLKNVHQYYGGRGMKRFHAFEKGLWKFCTRLSDVGELIYQYGTFQTCYNCWQLPNHVFKRKPNSWVVCEAWPHLLKSQPHHTNQRSSVMWMGSPTVLLGLMHHSNILVFFLCHGFITLFISKDINGYSKQLKTCSQVGTMLHMNSNHLVSFFPKAYQIVKKRHIRWSCNMAMWPYGIFMHIT